MMRLETLRTATCLVALLAISASVQAQLFRTYLSVNGLDSNPCRVALPCRQLPAALAAVSPGGEIWILDSANYNSGTVQITKSVTILAIPGAAASVLATGGTPAIEIATPSVTVTLRNLIVSRNVDSPGTHGVVMTNGSRLQIENSVFSQVPGTAVLVTTAAELSISDTIIRDGGAGVQLEGGVVADISNAKIFGNGGIAIFVNGGTPGANSATVSDSDLSGNLQGLNVFSNNSAVSRGAIVRSTIANNGFGVIAQAPVGGNAIVTVSGNLVTGNGTGLFQAGPAVLETLGNNTVRQNATTSTGVITSAGSL